MNFIDYLIQFFKRAPKKNAHISVPTLIGSADYPIPPITNSEKNWYKYLSQPFRSQWGGTFDEDNCATRQAIDLIEALLNYYLQNNLFPPVLTQFLRGHFCNAQGFVKLSIRYNATLNKTTPLGANVANVWDNFATYGIVPESLWPDPPNPFTWNQYYIPVPSEVVAFGKKTTTLFNIPWSPIWNNNFQAPNIEILQQHLSNSPVYFAGPLWITDANGIQHWDGKKDYVHARLLYQEDQYQEVLDSYGPNYLEKMDSAFPLPCAIVAGIEVV